jgi:REP element-mobilizing transposase RayT
MSEAGQEKLYRYISGILKNKNCHLYCINGVENHIHIITHIHPMVAPAMLVKDIKLAAGSFIKEEKLFPFFKGWQEGYGAFTYSISAKDNLIEYVKNQKEHHRKVSFEDEYKNLLKEHHIDYDDKYFL